MRIVDVVDPGRDRLGHLFNEVPELYERMRPTYPDDLFADLASITGIGEGCSLVEVGCGTGQATRSLAALGCSVTAVEPGVALARAAHQRLASVPGVRIEHSAFEEWDDRGRRFDALVAASSWYWVEPSLGWPKAHRVVRVGGWMALLGHVVVRRQGEPEVFAETFGETIVRWYPTVQVFDGDGFADLLRTTSVYRRLSRARVSRCSTRSRNEFAPRWATGQRAATSRSCESAGARTDGTTPGWVHVRQDP